jgi:hypothetical protein
VGLLLLAGILARLPERLNSRFERELARTPPAGLRRSELLQIDTTLFFSFIHFSFFQLLMVDWLCVPNTSSALVISTIHTT